jgi:potassium-transporting ATPase potassium-binding subunit
MTPHGWLSIAVFVLAAGVTIRPLGGYMAWIFTGQHASIRFLRFFERGFFRLACVDPSSEQNWLNYAVALLIFNLAGMILLFATLILQGAMPLNPQHLGPLAPDLALNTAVSFVTNTSWQAYAGETTLSDLSQMAGITVQSFLSAATGMAVAIALVRGFARRSSETIGNAWVDLTRATLYVLLPICVIGALFLASQGVPQTLAGPVNASTLDGTTQIIARGCQNEDPCFARHLADSRDTICFADRRHSFDSWGSHFLPGARARSPRRALFHVPAALILSA